LHIGEIKNERRNAELKERLRSFREKYDEKAYEDLRRKIRLS